MKIPRIGSSLESVETVCTQIDDNNVNVVQYLGRLSTETTALETAGVGN